MLTLSLVILILGISLYLYSFYIKKKPYFLIQNSFNLSNKALSFENIQRYADKTSMITRIFGIFLIAFSLIQYYINSLEISLIVVFTSSFFFPFCSLYYQKKLTGKLPVSPLVILATLFVGIVISMGIGYIESDVIVDDEKISISGIYSEKIPLTKLNAVFLADTLPSIGNKTNGFSTGRINKGYFHSKSLGKRVKLFLHSESKPYIYIIDTDNKYVIVNFRKKETTLQVYDQLKGLAKNE